MDLIQQKVPVSRHSALKLYSEGNLELTATSWLEFSQQAKGLVLGIKAEITEDAEAANLRLTSDSIVRERSENLLAISSSRYDDYPSRRDPYNSLRIYDVGEEYKLPDWITPAFHESSDIIIRKDRNELSSEDRQLALAKAWPKADDDRSYERHRHRLALPAPPSAPYDRSLALVRRRDRYLSPPDNPSLALVPMRAVEWPEALESDDDSGYDRFALPEDEYSSSIRPVNSAFRGRNKARNRPRDRSSSRSRHVQWKQPLLLESTAGVGGQHHVSVGSDNNQSDDQSDLRNVNLRSRPATDRRSDSRSSTSSVTVTQSSAVSWSIIPFETLVRRAATQLGVLQEQSTTTSEAQDFTARPKGLLIWPSRSQDIPWYRDPGISTYDDQDPFFWDSICERNTASDGLPLPAPVDDSETLQNSTVSWDDFADRHSSKHLLGPSTTTAAAWWGTGWPSFGPQTTPPNPLATDSSIDNKSTWSFGRNVTSVDDESKTKEGEDTDLLPIVDLYDEDDWSGWSTKKKKRKKKKGMPDDVISTMFNEQLFPTDNDPWASFTTIQKKQKQRKERRVPWKASDQDAFLELAEAEAVATSQDDRGAEEGLRELGIPAKEEADAQRADEDALTKDATPGADLIFDRFVDGGEELGYPISGDELLVHDDQAIHSVQDGTGAMSAGDVVDVDSWTKIDRRLVSPRALTEAQERFDERPDCVIVLRIVTKEEIQYFAERTREIRSITTQVYPNSGRNLANSEESITPVDRVAEEATELSHPALGSSQPGLRRNEEKAGHDEEHLGPSQKAMVPVNDIGEGRHLEQSSEPVPNASDAMNDLSAARSHDNDTQNDSPNDVGSEKPPEEERYDLVHLPPTDERMSSTIPPFFSWPSRQQANEVSLSENECLDIILVDIDNRLRERRAPATRKLYSRAYEIALQDLENAGGWKLASQEEEADIYTVADLTHVCEEVGCKCLDIELVSYAVSKYPRAKLTVNSDLCSAGLWHKQRRP